MTSPGRFVPSTARAMVAAVPPSMGMKAMAMGIGLSGFRVVGLSVDPSSLPADQSAEYMGFTGGAARSHSEGVQPSTTPDAPTTLTSDHPP